MASRKILEELNVFSQCRRFNLSLWQCPSFLFLVMGVVIIASSLITYFLGNRYIETPETVALIVLLLTSVLLVVSFTITRSFERLAEANRMKSEFINVVSHQLRSPLSNLKWAIDLLISGRLGKIDEKQTEYFKILKENSARMAELISDLLTVSRIETATLPFRKQEFSLEDIIKEAILLSKPLAQASNVEIEFNQESGLPETFADPNQIKQVIQNLLDNAIRYIKDKGKVEVALKKKR
jgi:two-component system phosphate regulon sensor histidine kinase PhoR